MESDKTHRSPNDPDPTLFANFSRLASISQTSDPSVGIFTYSGEDLDEGSICSLVGNNEGWFEEESPYTIYIPSITYKNRKILQGDWKGRTKDIVSSMSIVWLIRVLKFSTKRPLKSQIHMRLNWQKEQNSILQKLRKEGRNG